MSSLANCLDKMSKLLGPTEAKLLLRAAQKYRDEGFEAHKANTGAVNDVLKDLENDLHSIHEQTREAAKPAEVAPEAEGFGAETATPTVPVVQPEATKTAREVPDMIEVPSMADTSVFEIGQRVQVAPDVEGRVVSKGDDHIVLETDNGKQVRATGRVKIPVVRTAEVVAPSFALPPDIAKSSPRYSYGDKQFTLNFANELDKALYILAQKTPSKADARFLKAVMDHSGMTEAEARQAGVDVRYEIKQIARDAPAGEIDVPQVHDPAPPTRTDSVIRSLERAKINKPGRVSANTPFSLAWDGAIDTAIVAIKAGRKVADVVREAVEHFRSKMPNASKDHEVRLERQIKAMLASREESVASSPLPEPTVEGPVRQHTEQVRAHGVPIESEPHDVLSHAEQRAEAKAYIERHGESEAVQRVLDRMSAKPDDTQGGTDSHVLHMVEERLLREAYSLPEGAERNVKIAAAHRLVSQVSRRGTTIGRQLNSMAAVKAWSFEGLFAQAAGNLHEKLEARIGKAGVEAADAGAKTVNDINAQAADKIAAEAPVEKVTLTKTGADKAGVEVKSKQDIPNAAQGMGRQIRKVIKKHIAKPDPTGKTLEEKLTDDAGVKPDQAATLAKAVRKKTSELTAEQKRKAIEAMVARMNRVPTGKARATLIDRLLKASDLGALDGVDVLDAVAHELKLPSLNAEQAARLKEHADKIKNSTGQAKQEAMVNALTEIKKISGIGAKDVISSLAYAHMLSGPTTQAVNFESTGIKELFDGAALSVTNPKQFADVWRGMAAGLSRGVEQAKRTLKTGYTDPGITAKAIDEGVQSASEGQGIAPFGTLEILSRGDPKSLGGKALKGYSLLARYVSRFMQASDAIFYESAKSGFEYMSAAKIAEAAQAGMPRKAVYKATRDLLQVSPEAIENAMRQARSEGTPKDEFAFRTAEILREKRHANLGPEATADATDFGRRATFNDREPRGWLGAIAKHVSQFTSDKPLAKAIVPFTRIVANVGNAGLNYTPWGFKRAAMGFTGKGNVLRGEPLKPWEKKIVLAEATLGTLGMTALAAYAMDAKDKDGMPAITNMGPANTNERNQLRATGWTPQSVRIGGRWIPYNTTPMALPLGIVGKWADMLHYDAVSEDNAATVAGRLLAAVPGTLTNMSFLNGIGQFMDAIRDSESAAGAAENVASQTLATAIPGGNLSQQVDRTVDPTVRETKGVKGVVLGKVPGARETFPERIDSRGRTIESAPIQRIVGKPEGGDELDQIIANRQLFIPKITKRALDLGRTKRPMTDDEFHEYQIEAGKDVSHRLEVIAARLRTLPKADAQKIIDNVAQDSRARALKKLERAAMPTAAR